jgi:hypothetical protein
VFQETSLSPAPSKLTGICVTGAPVAASITSTRASPRAWALTVTVGYEP